MYQLSRTVIFLTSFFTCPVCGNPLAREKNRCVCSGGHSFDLAAEGYVHLLPANRMHSKLPGDDKIMVAARNRFLSAGYYAPLCDAICRLCEKYAQEGAAVLDSGCGDGYYTSAIFNRLSESGKSPHIAGIDISKSAVRLAAKREKRAEFAVASAYHLPVGDASADILLNCFSPLCVEEFYRALKPDGHFIYVVPAPRHLWQLKCAVYDTPYENERFTAQYDGFEHEQTVSIVSEITVPDEQAISDLFTMTPYFWKTPQAGITRLRTLKTLKTEISFDIHIYKKL
ncbi:MAG: methyltransferase domain-containing protein [Clostridia bacterium]|nr:methyltransferase domain-containing protein [Clostridia bacterium]